jgi:hypothetical protein
MHKLPDNVSHSMQHVNRPNNGQGCFKLRNAKKISWNVAKTRSYLRKTRLKRQTLTRLVIRSHVIYGPVCRNFATFVGVSACICNLKQPCNGGCTSRWGQELFVHSGNRSNVHFSGAKGSDPFPECRRAPNLNYTQQWVLCGWSWRFLPYTITPSTRASLRTVKRLRR